MKRTWFSIALGGIVLAAGVQRAGAQALVSSPVRFGLLGGATTPLSTLSDVAKTGWHAGALLDLGLPLVPLGFRIDGEWHQFGTKQLADGSSSKQRVISGTLDAVYNLGAAPIVKPYLIAGVGLYNVHSTVDVPIVGEATNTQTKFGVNAGLGLRVQLTGFSTFAEARWHDVFTKGNSIQMVPISVGFTF